MRDRWVFVSLGAGLITFCTVAFLSGYHVEVAGMFVATVIVGVVGAVALLRAVRHRRLVRGLRRTSVATEVAGTAVRSGDLGGSVFVAGLGRPTIFCDRGLPERLTPPQLRAVLLHERAHQRSRDPARMLLVELIAPLLRRVAVGRQWLAATLARREIAADRYAMTHGASAADLAGALLALPQLTRPHVAGFTPAIDLRLRALVGDGSEVRVPAAVSRLSMLTIGGLGGASACAWLLHRLLADAGLVCC